MRFTILPFRRFSAAENMAVDAGMISLACERSEVLFRFYGWSGPAITFGYSQPLEGVVPEMDDAPLSPSLARVRRETGGGLVDHRRDLTYAMCIPRAHPAWSARPQTVYRTLHTALGESLVAHGVATRLAPCPEACGERGARSRLADACFTRAEPDDVIEAATGRKLAGAAMRRHRDALLLQGSIERSEGLPMLDEPVWRKDFTGRLAAALECPPPVTEESWPENLPAPEAVVRFASDTWNARR